MNPHLPSLYYIKSDKDFGQNGVVFKTPYCAEIWIDHKFGKGGYQEGIKRKMFSVETAEILYYPCSINPSHTM